MKTRALYIPLKLYRRLRTRARERGESMRAVVLRALRREVGE